MLKDLLIISLVGIFFISLSVIHIQASSALDPNFTPVVESKPTTYLPMYSHAVQADGKIIVGGSFGVINGKVRQNFARLNADGSTDESFQVGNGVDEQVMSIAIQPDGKILIGGFFTVYNGFQRSYLARLNADGSLDASFNVVLNNVVYRIAVQTDNKILVGGEFTNVNGAAVNYLVRLNANGTSDSSFNAGNPQISRPVRAIVPQTDGKIMVGGQSISFGSNLPLLRLNSDGSTDSSFTNGVESSASIYDIAIQSDGKYLIGGSFGSYNGTPIISICRLNTNGTLDTSFTSGLANFNTISKIALQTDGKIIIVGAFLTYNSTTVRNIARLNTNGTLDNTFNSGNGLGIINGTTTGSLTVSSDSTVLVSGNFEDYNVSTHWGIVKINSNGSSDETFSPRLGRVGLLTDIIVQPDGRIIVSGGFSYINGIVREKIARLLPNGAVDTSFDSGTGVNGGIAAMFLQSDGKILIAGNFISYNGIGRDNVARLNSDGSLDTSFNSGLMDEFGVVDDIVQTSSGKIVIGGLFGLINGTERLNLAQLNADGSVDTGFVHPILNGRVRSLLQQPNDKLFIGGATFTFSQPQSFFKGIVKLNADGSLDNSFAIGTGVNGTVFNIAQQIDGKIVIGGGFLSYNGVNRQSIARINTNGTLDTSFNPGAGGGQINKIAIDVTGKIFVAGNIQTFDGIAVGNLVRLRSNGSFDQSFPIGKGSNRAISALAIQNPSLVLVGSGSEFNGIPRGGFARLSNISSVVPNFDYDGDGKTDISIFRPSNGQWWLNRSSTSNFVAAFGNSTDKLVPADFTGDGKTDIAFWRPSTGEWFILRSEDSSFFSFPFGTNGDIPTVGDFDGDGIYDPAIFRPSTGTWFISTLTQGVIIQSFGLNGDVPAIGDYDGDGKSDIAIYRPSNGQWWLNQSSAGIVATTFGNSADKVVQADYTNDGKTDIAFWRPSTGEWFILRSEDNSFYSFPFGTNGDIPIVGDFDGDGKADSGVFRPSSGTWFISTLTQGVIIQSFGLNDDLPTPSAFVY